MNHEIFEWGQYQQENAKGFYVALSKKLTLRSLSQRRVTNNSNISANSILYLKRIKGMNQRTRWVLLMKKTEVKTFVQVYLYMLYGKLQER
jgi:hypothetical protein